MKDAKGHGSNAKGIAQAAGYSVVQKDSLGHFIQGPSGEHGPYFGARGAWKDAARLATIPSYANDLGASRILASGPKSAPAPVHDSMATQGRHGYNAAAVQSSIDSSNRHGRKIGGREAKMIHALLRGRE
jgi:hypothetical protein